MPETSSSVRPPAPASPREVRVVFGALMLITLLASLDQTIVSTALPTIVGELGGLEHLSWIVTSYMLATTIVTPLYGKFGDLYGRKIILQGAIVLFLIGSVLCGLSQSMAQLIVFRAIQGLGGGGLMVTAVAIVGDIIAPRERGRYQGFFGAVFGVSTVIGPLIGGFFVEHLTWRWIFYVNLPLGLVALLVIGVVFTSPSVRKAHSIDVAGAALLALVLTSGVLLASLGGHTLPWASPAALTLAAVTLVGIVTFLKVEQRAAEPILPPSLFTVPTFSVAAAVGFIVGVAMFGSITFMPVYLQVVKGISPSRAGMALTPMMFGVLTSSIVSGQIITRVGRYRVFPIIGTALMSVALMLLSTLGTDTPIAVASAFMLLLGLGLGMVMQVLVLAVQNAVEYRHLGVATSGATLFRSIGGSVGVAVFGAVFAAGLARELATHLPPGASLPTATDAVSIARLPDALRAIYLDAFVTALQPVFRAAAVVAMLGVSLTWLLREIPLRGPVRSEDIGDSFAMPRDATSLEELQAIVARVSRHHRWDAIRRIAARLELDLEPDEIWLFTRLGGSDEAVALPVIAGQASIPMAELEQLAERLAARGLAIRGDHGALLATARGRMTYQKIVTRYRERLTELVERWSPEEHAEVRAMVNDFARGLIADLPRPPSSRHANRQA